LLKSANSSIRFAFPTVVCNNSTIVKMAVQVYFAALASLIILAAVRLYQYSKLSARPTGYPPGPKTAPFLGNLHQVPISRPELRFTEYARQFGALTGLKLGCQNLVILNTWQAVRDLVEQKGSIYSSRPSIPVCDIVVPNGENPALSVYGDLWRGQRKRLVEFLGGDRTDKMKPVQDAESTQMIYDLMNDPENFERHVDRSFGAAILATVFGQRGKTMQPGGKLESFFKVEAQWAAALGPTSYPPLNSFPFLGSVPDWLTPWKGWKDRATLIRNEQELLYGTLVSETRQKLTEGKGTDCFLASVLKTHEKERYNDKFLSHLSGVLLEGGAETSASSIMVFIMAMAAYPDVLLKVQEEVDRVCGTSRMPCKDDIGSLPYVKACMLEILRWRPIIPLGVPHNTTANDTYGSYTVPIDTDIIVNTWRINHDESFYDEPGTFNPDRYIQDDFGRGLAARSQDIKGRRMNYTFGAGRRVCPGQKFAENSMTMHFAKLAWAFDIKRAGALPSDTWDGWTDGLVIRPKNLKVKFELRSGRKATVEHAWSEADSFLRQFED
jgi:cytochrome P450